MKMRTLILIWMGCTLHSGASDVRVLGICHEYSRQLTTQEFPSGNEVTVCLNWLELETNDLDLNLAAEFFANLRPGKWAEEDPIVESDAHSLLVVIGNETWSVGPSKSLEGKIIFRQVQRLGGLTFSWADGAGSFMQPELHAILKEAIDKRAPKHKKGEEGVAPQSAAGSVSELEEGDNPQPELEERSR